ncbi:1-acyl-sn-glycerol-3-phosphate acyltransferase [Chitinispirillum alkaliphilum]|nr:1-acyl-sn-glycerol-3-phosphate acyltransferase [Chitinispirillum alkaliphilum]
MNIIKAALRWFVWTVISKIFILCHIKGNYHFSRKKPCDPIPKPPFLVIANHGTFFDPWMAGFYSFTPFLFMINDDAFRASKFTSLYLKIVGTIPKKKGASDFKAMKTTLSCLKSGKAVCIFPEGQTTWDGETQPIYSGIEKIAKRAKCPIMFVRFQGNFLSKPWWAKTQRKGKVAISFKTLSREEIEQLSEPQLLEKIKSSIYQNDIKDPSNLKIPFKGKNMAEGLENFLWVCRECNKEDSLKAKNNTIECTNCNQKYDIDAHCRFYTRSSPAPEFDLHDWAGYQKQDVKNRIKNASANDNILTFSTNVEIQRAENNRQTYSTLAQDGTLTLTREIMSFKSDELELRWPVSSTANFVVQRKNIFQFDNGDNEIRVVLKDKSPMKWVTYLRYLNGFEEYENRGHL